MKFKCIIDETKSLYKILKKNKLLKVCMYKLLTHRALGKKKYPTVHFTGYCQTEHTTDAFHI